MSNIQENYESLVDLVMGVQFVNCWPREVVGFLKERKFWKLDEMIESAEVYVHAHGPTLSRVILEAINSI